MSLRAEKLINARFRRVAARRAAAGRAAGTVAEQAAVPEQAADGLPTRADGTGSSDLLRDRSVRHYLGDPTESERLHSTVTLAAHTLGFPLAMVNILDEDVQHTISWSQPAAVRTMPRSDALCDAVIRTGESVVVPDAGRDGRFAHLPAVVNGDVGSYIGVPLTGRESLVVGTLCLVDTEPRTIGADELTLLTYFARIVEDQLELLRRRSDTPNGTNIPTRELAQAIADHTIAPWYQPVVSLATGRTIGFEALARWQHPSGSVSDPKNFVPLAEDSELIVELDLMVIRQAMHDLARWQQTNPDLRMSVNVSGRHFDSEGCASAIGQAISDAGVRPQAVDIELTETARLSGRSGARLVRELAGTGARVWLDDFGTGWSTLDHLLSLPVDGVKIDRVMALAMGSHIGNALVRAVTGLAAELGLMTTIEGIETTEQADLGRRLGCDFGQGYLWSQPLPAAAVDDWLAGREQELSTFLPVA